MTISATGACSFTPERVYGNVFSEDSSIPTIPEGVIPDSRACVTMGFFFCFVLQPSFVDNKLFIGDAWPRTLA